MADFSDLNVSLCFETIVVNILEVIGSTMVDLILAVLDNDGQFSVLMHMTSSPHH